MSWKITQSFNLWHWHVKNPSIRFDFDLKKSHKYNVKTWNFILNLDKDGYIIDENFILFNKEQLQNVGNEKGMLNMYDIRSPGDAVNFSNSHSYAIHDLQTSADQSLLLFHFVFQGAYNFCLDFIISSSADKTAMLHTTNDLTQLKTYKYIVYMFSFVCDLFERFYKA
jgi:hypothetical protein